MTPEKQRIAIHQARGLPVMSDGWHPTYNDPDNASCAPAAEPLETPNYPADLNAMHEAEKVFDDCEIQFGKYIRHLYGIMEPHRHVVHATAAQRAEAFLRTIGKWAE